MGATCTLPSRNKIAIPSRIIMVQPKSTKARGSQSNLNDGGNPIASRKSISIVEVQLPHGADEDIKSGRTSIPPMFKYDLSDLGIGEHYLRKQLKEAKQGDPTEKKLLKKQSKNSLKWDRAVVQMRVQFESAPHDDSLYNNTDLSIREYKASKPKKYAKMFNNGLPMRYRWSVWKEFVDIDKFYVRNLYERFKSLTSPWETTIRKDLSRSFPQEPYFTSEKFECIGQEHLFNVLKAISLYFPNIGYTQSMNFIVGFLLLVNGANELEAFWMFITLARDHRFLLMGLFEKDLPLLDFYIFAFYQILEVEMPEVYAHIKQQQIPDQLWLLKWFMTLFLYSLPPEMVVEIWDFLLEDGLLGMVKVALGITKAIEEDLLSLDIFGFDQLFNHLKGEKKPSDKSFAAHNKSMQENMHQANINVQTPHVASAHHIANVQNNLKDRNQENPIHIASVHHDVSEFNFNFKKLNLAQVLSYARRVVIDNKKLKEITQLYFEKQTKPLPEPYNTVLSEWDVYMYNPPKIEEFQRNIDYHILKSELTEPVYDEIIICNLLDDDQSDIILKDIAF